MLSTERDSFPVSFHADSSNIIERLFLYVWEAREDREMREITILPALGYSVVYLLAM